MKKSKPFTIVLVFFLITLFPLCAHSQLTVLNKDQMSHVFGQAGFMNNTGSGALNDLASLNLLSDLGEFFDIGNGNGNGWEHANIHAKGNTIEILIEDFTIDVDAMTIELFPFHSDEATGNFFTLDISDLSAKISGKILVNFRLWGL